MAYNGDTDDVCNPPASVSTSSGLLERVKARDGEAWRRFVYLYGPWVYAWCRRSGLQGADAKDLAQEVFCAVAASLATYRRIEGKGSFRGWLWGITRNKIADHFRRLGARPQAQGGTDAQQAMVQVPDQTPSDTDLGSDPAGHGTLARRAIDLIRAGAEDRTWKAFWRVVVDGQPAADVAAELGMTIKAVYEAKYRLVKRLREELDDSTG
jgi:RNA polymerase sigma-70 factor (ECF subfamily)